MIEFIEGKYERAGACAPKMVTFYIYVNIVLYSGSAISIQDRQSSIIIMSTRDKLVCNNDIGEM